MSYKHLGKLYLHIHTSTLFYIFGAEKKCNCLYQRKYTYVSVFIFQDLFIARSNWKQVDHWPKGIMSKCKTYSRIWPMIMKFAISCSIRNIEIHPFYGRYIYNYKYYWVKMHYFSFLLFYIVEIASKVKKGNHFLHCKFIFPII